MLKSSKIHSLLEANSAKKPSGNPPDPKFWSHMWLQDPMECFTRNLPALLPYRTRRWTCRWTASGTLLQLLPLFRADKDSFNSFHVNFWNVTPSYSRIQMQLAPSRLSRLPVTLSTWWFLCINAAQVPAWSDRCRHIRSDMFWTWHFVTFDIW